MGINMKWSDPNLCNCCDRGYDDQICKSRKIKIYTVWHEKNHHGLVAGKISEVRKEMKKYGFHYFKDRPKFKYQIKADCIRCAVNIWNMIRGYPQRRDCIKFFCNYEGY